MCAMCVYVLLVVARIGLSVCLHTHTKLIHRFWLFVRSFSALYGYFYVFISGILLVLGHPVSIWCTLYFSNDVWLYTLAIAWMLCVCVFVRFFRVLLVLVDSIFALAPSRIKFVTFFIMIFASLSLCVNVLLFNGCYLYYIKLELGLLFFFCALLL